jgi:hypothetical protein
MGQSRMQISNYIGTDFGVNQHSRQFVRGSHLQSRAAAVLSTVANVVASTEPENATDTPFGN